MPSPRNSRFIEGFDEDDSDPSSSESLPSAPSPEQSSDSTLEQLAQMVSGLEIEIAPRSSNQQQQGGTMQPQAPTQAEASGVTQTDDPSTVAAGTSSKGVGAATDEHQESNPEEAPEEEISGLPTEQGTDQHEQHGAVEEPSAKTANISLHRLFDEVLREQSITPEEMHHASKHIQANFGKFERDLERFAEQRLQISLKLQRWFETHQLVGSWDTKNPCLKCLLLFSKIDQLYLAACADIRDMMAVLEKGIRASILLFKSTHKHVPDNEPDRALSELCAPLLQDLASTKRMLQALEDDAEKRKGWPQVSMSEQHSSMTSQSEYNQDESIQSESDEISPEAIAISSASAVIQINSHINEVFGAELFPLKYFQENVGVENDEVKFAIHPNVDISAQQWFQPHAQWFNIGHFSRSRGRIEGTLASHRLREEAEPRVHALPQNSLEYFKAVAKQHEARTMGLAFGSEELRACLTNVLIDRTGQEAANTASVVEAPTRSEPEPGDTEMANEDQDANTDGAKSKQVKSKKSKSKKQKKKKKGRR